MNPRILKIFETLSKIKGEFKFFVKKDEDYDGEDYWIDISIRSRDGVELKVNGGDNSLDKIENNINNFIQSNNLN